MLVAARVGKDRQVCLGLGSGIPDCAQESVPKCGEARDVPPKLYSTLCRAPRNTPATSIRPVEVCQSKTHLPCVGDIPIESCEKKVSPSVLQHREREPHPLAAELDLHVLQVPKNCA